MASAAVETADNPAVQPKKLDSDTAAKVLKQVNYYFSDSSLPRDKFLLGQLKENDGLVPLELICSFSRMKTHLGLKDGVTKIPEELVLGVKEVLESSASFRFSADGKSIGPVKEVLSYEEAKALFDSRSLFASPFPWNSTVDDVTKVFSAHGNVVSVRMRRLNVEKKPFLGSVFVEFSTADEMLKVVGKEIEANGIKLSLKSRADFLTAFTEDENKKIVDIHSEQSKTDISKKRKEPEESSFEINFQPGVVLSFSVSTPPESSEAAPEAAEKKPEEDAEKAAVEAAETAKKVAEADESEAAEEAGSEPAAKRSKVDVQRTGLGRDGVKAIFSRFGYVRYVDFNPRVNDKSGFVRYENSDQAKAAVAAAASEQQKGFPTGHGSIIADVAVLTGKEESDYWEVLKASQEKTKLFKQSEGRFSRGRGRGGRGGRGGGRGRSNRF